MSHPPTSPPDPLPAEDGASASRGVARVYGEVFSIVAPGANQATTRLAVACPFCQCTHLHEPTRSLLTQPLVSDDPRSVYTYLNSRLAAPMPDRPVNWETDRVALCRKGTYHIVGWSDPRTLPLPAQPMMREAAQRRAARQTFASHLRATDPTAPDADNASRLEVLMRPHMGRGVLVS